MASPTPTPTLLGYGWSPGVLPITGFNLEGMTAIAGGLLLLGGGALLAARAAGQRGLPKRRLAGRKPSRR